MNRFSVPWNRYHRDKYFILEFHLFKQKEAGLIRARAICLPIYQTFFRFTVLNFRCLSFSSPLKTILVFLSSLLCNKQKYIAVLFSQLSQRVRRSIFLGANPYYAFVIFVSRISRDPLYFHFSYDFFSNCNLHEVHAVAEIVGTTGLRSFWELNGKIIKIDQWERW